jgi:hypothetical protein
MKNSLNQESHVLFHLLPPQVTLLYSLRNKSTAAHYRSTYVSAEEMYADQWAWRS